MHVNLNSWRTYHICHGRCISWMFNGKTGKHHCITSICLISFPLCLPHLHKHTRFITLSINPGDWDFLFFLWHFGVKLSLLFVLWYHFQSIYIQTYTHKLAHTHTQKSLSFHPTSVSVCVLGKCPEGVCSLWSPLVSHLDYLFFCFSKTLYFSVPCLSKSFLVSL